jgi:hypothetical protein
MFQNQINLSHLNRLSSLLYERSISPEEIEIDCSNGLTITGMSDSTSRNKQICHLIRSDIEQIGLPDLPVTLNYLDTKQREMFCWDSFHLSHVNRRNNL